MTAATRKFQPTIESLEKRDVPTTWSFANGLLSVFGTNSAEIISLRQINGLISVDGVNGSVSAGQVRAIQVGGYGGNDIINLNSGSIAGQQAITAPASIWGGSGDDQLVGGAANDVIYGEYGNDALYGVNGSDVIYGGDGNDYLNGGNNQDTMDGGPGANTYFESYTTSQPALGGTNRNDIWQKLSGTCVILSTLSSAAGTGTNLAGRITYSGNNWYNVRMFHPATLAAVNVSVYFDGTWYDNTNVSNPPTFSQDFGNDPKPMADGEFWTVLYQRAYLTLMNNTGYEYHQPNLALQAVTGRAATTYYNQSGFGSADVTRLLTALNQGRCVTAATKSSASYLTTDRLVESHAYTVVSVFSSGGNYYVQLRNPWAKDCRYASNDGADDGYITIRWYDFAYSMSQYCFA